MGIEVGDHIVARLREWGVEQVFGYPGDGIGGLVAAFGRADGLAFVQTRHEEMAAFAATGYAKFGGGLGVCAATSGPGAIHLLNGLYDAKLDHVPVLALVGQTARSARGVDFQQEVDLQGLFKDVASAYLVEVDVPEQLPAALDRAIRVARTRRAPTVVIVPNDVQHEQFRPPETGFGRVGSSGPDGVHAPRLLPPSDEIAAAAELLDGARRPAILVGQGARGAADEVAALAERLGAGVAKALLGKDVLPDDLPYVTGAIGLLGTRPSYELMRDCDALLIVGSNFPYTQFLPEPGSARGVQIDCDGTRIGMRYPTEVNLVGDAAATVAALTARVSPDRDPAWRETVEDNVAHWWETIERQAMLDADPVNPMRVVWELSRRLPEGAIVTADSGSSTTWYARCLRLRHGMRGSLSGTLASMGSAVPYAIGAKFAHPDRPVIALAGDGAMQMNGLGELLTIRRYQQRWSDPRLVVCVFHNNDLNQVTWELRAMGGAPKFPDSQDLPDVSYAELARVAGLGAIAVDRPEDLGPAWERALAADGPVLLDVRCDPGVPPIPPHATRDQIEKTAAAMLRGDPEAWHVLVQGAQTKIQEFFHR
ncbi:thiamine pyrophosphate-requiring protein [Nocardia thailandica]|uniref:thiamine pyrophosphate-requiring protein n=1 Tax=Nocardia thailandica TaxID=257275 RepID=UPI0002EA1F2F|nr:thiamine pyrophosphate-requiring protein [Nocardia thailandica]